MSMRRIPMMAASAPSPAVVAMAMRRPTEPHVATTANCQRRQEGLQQQQQQQPLRADQHGTEADAAAKGRRYTPTDEPAASNYHHGFLHPRCDLQTSSGVQSPTTGEARRFNGDNRAETLCGLREDLVANANAHSDSSIDRHHADPHAAVCLPHTRSADRLFCDVAASEAPRTVADPFSLAPSPICALRVGPSSSPAPAPPRRPSSTPPVASFALRNIAPRAATPLASSCVGGPSSRRAVALCTVASTCSVSTLSRGGGRRGRGNDGTFSHDAIRKSTATSAAGNSHQSTVAAPSIFGGVGRGINTGIIPTAQAAKVRAALDAVPHPSEEGKGARGGAERSPLIGTRSRNRTSKRGGVSTFAVGTIPGRLRKNHVFAIPSAKRPEWTPLRAFREGIEAAVDGRGAAPLSLAEATRINHLQVPNAQQRRLARRALRPKQKKARRMTAGGVAAAYFAAQMRLTSLWDLPASSEGLPQEGHGGQRTKKLRLLGFTGQSQRNLARVKRRGLPIDLSHGMAALGDDTPVQKSFSPKRALRRIVTEMMEGHKLIVAREAGKKAHDEASRASGSSEQQPGEVTAAETAQQGASLATQLIVVGAYSSLGSDLRMRNGVYRFPVSLDDPLLSSGAPPSSKAGRGGREEPERNPEGARATKTVLLELTPSKMAGVRRRYRQAWRAVRLRASRNAAASAAANGESALDELPAGHLSDKPSSSSSLVPSRPSEGSVVTTPSASGGAAAASNTAAGPLEKFKNTFEEAFAAELTDVSAAHSASSSSGRCVEAKDDGDKKVADGFEARRDRALFNAEFKSVYRGGATLQTPLLRGAYSFIPPALGCKVSAQGALAVNFKTATYDSASSREVARKRFVDAVVSSFDAQAAISKRMTDSMRETLEKRKQAKKEDSTPAPTTLLPQLIDARLHDVEGTNSKEVRRPGRFFAAPDRLPNWGEEVLVAKAEVSRDGGGGSFAHHSSAADEGATPQAKTSPKVAPTADAATGGVTKALGVAADAAVPATDVAPLSSAPDAPLVVLCGVPFIRIGANTNPLADFTSEADGADCGKCGPNDNKKGEEEPDKDAATDVKKKKISSSGTETNKNADADEYLYFTRSSDYSRTSRRVRPLLVTTLVPPPYASVAALAAVDATIGLRTASIVSPFEKNEAPQRGAALDAGLGDAGAVHDAEEAQWEAVEQWDGSGGRPADTSVGRGSDDAREEEGGGGRQNEVGDNITSERLPPTIAPAGAADAGVRRQLRFRRLRRIWDAMRLRAARRSASSFTLYLGRFQYTRKRMNDVCDSGFAFAAMEAPGPIGPAGTLPLGIHGTESTRMVAPPRGAQYAPLYPSDAVPAPLTHMHIHDPLAASATATAGGLVDGDGQSSGTVIVPRTPAIYAFDSDIRGGVTPTLRRIATAYTHDSNPHMAMCDAGYLRGSVVLPSDGWEWGPRMQLRRPLGPDIGDDRRRAVSPRPVVTADGDIKYSAPMTLLTGDENSADRSVSIGAIKGPLRALVAPAAESLRPSRILENTIDSFRDFQGEALAIGDDAEFLSSAFTGSLVFPAADGSASSTNPTSDSNGEGDDRRGTKPRATKVLTPSLPFVSAEAASQLEAARVAGAAASGLYAKGPDFAGELVEGLIDTTAPLLLRPEGSASPRAGPEPAAPIGRVGGRRRRQRGDTGEFEEEPPSAWGGGGREMLRMFHTLPSHVLTDRLHVSSDAREFAQAESHNSTALNCGGIDADLDSACDAKDAKDTEGLVPAIEVRGGRSMWFAADDADPQAVSDVRAAAEVIMRELFRDDPATSSSSSPSQSRRQQAAEARRARSAFLSNIQRLFALAPRLASSAALQIRADRFAVERNQPFSSGAYTISRAELRTLLDDDSGDLGHGRFSNVPYAPDAAAGKKAAGGDVGGEAARYAVDEIPAAAFEAASVANNKNSKSFWSSGKGAFANSNQSDGSAPRPPASETVLNIFRAASPHISECRYNEWKGTPISTPTPAPDRSAAASVALFAVAAAGYRAPSPRIVVQPTTLLSAFGAAPMGTATATAQSVSAPSVSTATTSKQSCSQSPSTRASSAAPAPTLLAMGGAVGPLSVVRGTRSWCRGYATTAPATPSVGADEVPVKRGKGRPKKVVAKVDTTPAWATGAVADDAGVEREGMAKEGFVLGNVALGPSSTATATASSSAAAAQQSSDSIGKRLAASDVYPFAMRFFNGVRIDDLVAAANAVHGPPPTVASAVAAPASSSPNDKQKYHPRSRAGRAAAAEAAAAEAESKIADGNRRISALAAVALAEGCGSDFVGAVSAMLAETQKAELARERGTVGTIVNAQKAHKESLAEAARHRRARQGLGEAHEEIESADGEEEGFDQQQQQQRSAAASGRAPSAALSALLASTAGAGGFNAADGDSDVGATVSKLLASSGWYCGSTQAETIAAQQAAEAQLDTKGFAERRQARYEAALAARAAAVDAQIVRRMRGVRVYAGDGDDSAAGVVGNGAATAAASSSSSSSSAQPQTQHTDTATARGAAALAAPKALLCIPPPIAPPPSNHSDATSPLSLPTADAAASVSEAGGIIETQLDSTLSHATENHPQTASPLTTALLTTATATATPAAPRDVPNTPAEVAHGAGDGFTASFMDFFTPDSYFELRRMIIASHKVKEAMVYNATKRKYAASRFERMADEIEASGADVSLETIDALDSADAARRQAAAAVTVTGGEGRGDGDHHPSSNVQQSPHSPLSPTAAAQLDRDYLRAVMRRRAYIRELQDRVLSTDRSKIYVTATREAAAAAVRPIVPPGGDIELLAAAEGAADTAAAPKTARAGEEDTIATEEEEDGSGYAEDADDGDEVENYDAEVRGGSKGSVSSVYHGDNDVFGNFGFLKACDATTEILSRYDDSRIDLAEDTTLNMSRIIRMTEKDFAAADSSSNDKGGQQPPRTTKGRRSAAAARRRASLANAVAVADVSYSAPQSLMDRLASRHFSLRSHASALTRLLNRVAYMKASPQYVTMSSLAFIDMVTPHERPGELSPEVVAEQRFFVARSRAVHELMVVPTPRTVADLRRIHKIHESGTSTISEDSGAAESGNYIPAADDSAMAAGTDRDDNGANGGGGDFPTVPIAEDPTFASMLSGDDAVLFEPKLLTAFAALKTPKRLALDGYQQRGEETTAPTTADSNLPAAAAEEENNSEKPTKKKAKGDAEAVAGDGDGPFAVAPFTAADIRYFRTHHTPPCAGEVNGLLLGSLNASVLGISGGGSSRNGTAPASDGSAPQPQEGGEAEERLRSPDPEYDSAATGLPLKVLMERADAMEAFIAERLQRDMPADLPSAVRAAVGVATSATSASKAHPPPPMLSTASRIAMGLADAAGAQRLLSASFGDDGGATSSSVDNGAASGDHSSGAAIVADLQNRGNVTVQRARIGIHLLNGLYHFRGPPTIINHPIPFLRTTPARHMSRDVSFCLVTSAIAALQEYSALRKQMPLGSYLTKYSSGAFAPIPTTIEAVRSLISHPLPNTFGVLAFMAHQERVFGTATTVAAAAAKAKVEAAEAAAETSNSSFGSHRGPSPHSSATAAPPHPHPADQQTSIASVLHGSIPYGDQTPQQRAEASSLPKSATCVYSRRGALTIASEEDFLQQLKDYVGAAQVTEAMSTMGLLSPAAAAAAAAPPKSSVATAAAASSTATTTTSTGPSLASPVLASPLYLFSSARLETKMRNSYTIPVAFEPLTIVDCEGITHSFRVERPDGASDEEMRDRMRLLTDLLSEELARIHASVVGSGEKLRRQQRLEKEAAAEERAEKARLAEERAERAKQSKPAKGRKKLQNEERLAASLARKRNQAELAKAARKARKEQAEAKRAAKVVRAAIRNEAEEAAVLAAVERFNATMEAAAAAENDVDVSVAAARSAVVEQEEPQEEEEEEKSSAGEIESPSSSEEEAPTADRSHMAFNTHAASVASLAAEHGVRPVYEDETTPRPLHVSHVSADVWRSAASSSAQNSATKASSHALVEREVLNKPIADAAGRLVVAYLDMRPDSPAAVAAAAAAATADEARAAEAEGNVRVDAHAQVKDDAPPAAPPSSAPDDK